MTAVPSIRVEHPTPEITRVVLDRPETRNAQDTRLLYELDDAYAAAMADDVVKVVVLAADGPHFSSGHDLRDTYPMAEHESRSTWGGFDLPAVEGWYATERELYVGLCLRWRDLPKPTIAEVHGKVIAAGLMLVWPCDLVVAADDTEFSDPVVAFGVNGHEYFVHPWELGHRKAKELLFTGSSLTADEAKACGMVNQVVPRAELAERTMALAERIARRPSLGLKLAKQSVNQALDLQGQTSAVHAAFSLHQLGHAHNREVHGSQVDPAGMDLLRDDR